MRILLQRFKRVARFQFLRPKSGSSRADENVAGTRGQHTTDECRRPGGKSRRDERQNCSCHNPQQPGVDEQSPTHDEADALSCARNLLGDFRFRELNFLLDQRPRVPRKLREHFTQCPRVIIGCHGQPRGYSQ